MALIKCPECGKQQTDQNKKCPWCKYAFIEENRSCPRCGALHPISDTHCTDCGCAMHLDRSYFNNYITNDDKLNEMHSCPKCGAIYPKADNVCPSCGKTTVPPSNMSQETTTYVPKCPTCSSPDVRNISGVERGASIFSLGLFSKKINKTFKCNNCGYTW